MMNPILSRLCCCVPNSCPAPDEKSLVELTYYTSVAVRKITTASICQCECVPCTPISCTQNTPENPCPEPSGCISVGSVSCPGCDQFPTIGFEGVIPSSGVTYDETRSWYMQDPLVEQLPFVGAGVRPSAGQVFWFTPSGSATDFLSETLSPIWTWSKEVDGLLASRSPEGCCLCVTVTRDLVNKLTLNAEFTAWPAYAHGPWLFNIRSKNVNRYWWDIFEGKFRIKTSSVGSVLFQYEYAGKTLDELRAAVAAQTAAPVSILWASVPANPSTFSKNLLCDICLADQPGGLIYRITEQYVLVTGFLDQQVCPNPSNPFDVKSIALVGGCGWNTSVGGGRLESFDRDDCRDPFRVRYSDYLVLCNGVSVAGGGQLCLQEGQSASDLVLALPGICSTGQNFPGPAGSFEGSCADGSQIFYECGNGPSLPCNSYNIDPGTSWVCPFYTKQVGFGGAFSLCATNVDADFSFNGIDFGTTCTGACYSGSIKTTGGVYASEHRLVRRLS